MSFFSCGSVPVKYGKYDNVKTVKATDWDSRYIIKTDSEEYIVWNVRNCLYKSHDYLKRNTVSFRKENTEITIVQVDEPTDMRSVKYVSSTATRITIYSTILDVKEISSKENSE
ncbi:hypothetical protein [Treponema sp.]|uniref:hypothetical protein n=1 Tax=Treponema sp. TaxID=166 RepID=UPI003F10C1AF